MIEMGEKPFRATQIFGWLSKAVRSFDEMGNVPKSLREKLEAGGWYIGLPEAVRVQRSEDGTVKCLFRFADGTETESVFMKYEYGNSICISSQAGCRMGCTFCASTIDGLERSMTGGEMLGQVLAMRDLTGEDIGHVVIMGMGEPFDNYEEVTRFIGLIHDEKGYGLGLRNITVSTCGIIPGIERFAEDFPQVNLAVSLHAPNQALREQLMPRAAHWHLDDLISALESYPLKTRERITLEYLVIAGLNDQPEHVKQLARICSRLKAKLNLIPYNPTPGTPYQAPTPEELLRFEKALWAKDITAIVRKSKGQDIEAACGQLRAAHEAKAQEEA